MNDHAKALVAALRSGEYSQGIGRLRYGDKFCCLGVACNIYQELTGNGKWHHHPSIETMEFVGRTPDGVFYSEAYNLPVAVRDFFGFKYGGEFNEDLADHDADSLIQLNDNGASFAEIADIIESEPEGLFSNE